MLTLGCYRLEVPHQIFQFSLMMAIRIDSLFWGHHIPKELKRTKLSSITDERYMHKQRL